MDIKGSTELVETPSQLDSLKDSEGTPTENAVRYPSSLYGDDPMLAILPSSFPAFLLLTVYW